MILRVHGWLHNMEQHHLRMKVFRKTQGKTKRIKGALGKIYRNENFLEFQPWRR